MNTTIHVDDAGRHQVGWSRTGLDWTPTGEPFAKPRDAIDYATELEGWGPRRTAATTAGRGAEIALGAAMLGAAGVPEALRPSQRVSTDPATRPSVDASSLDAGESGGNRRTTGGPDVDQALNAPAPVVAHPPAATGVRTPAVPTSLEGPGGCALPGSSKDVGPVSSRSRGTPVLNLGF